MDPSPLAQSFDIVMSPGGGMAAVIVFQWGVIKRRSDALAEYYSRVLTAESRASRAEGELDALKAGLRMYGVEPD